jgi:ankyrin repeat protein
MTSKEIKHFFHAIRDGDLQKVSELINTTKEYVTICNVSPPKKDDGQSGLQVAFKTGNFDIAKLLIETGCDVNFIDKSDINDWTSPVLHDCIKATIFNTYTLQKDISLFDKAFSIFQLMLVKKADPNMVDSYGNNSLHRAIMDSRQMIVNPLTDLSNGILLMQLRAVFKELIISGADMNVASEKRPSPANMLANFRMEQYKLW